MADSTEPSDADTQQVWRGNARAPRPSDDEESTRYPVEDFTVIDAEASSAAREVMPRTTPAPPMMIYPPHPYGYPRYVPARRSNLLATLSLVFGLAGLSVCGLSVAGAIMGHVARRQLRDSDEEGDGVALAGIIVSWVVTVMYLAIGCGAVMLFLSLVDQAKRG